MNEIKTGKTNYEKYFQNMWQKYDLYLNPVQWTLALTVLVAHHILNSFFIIGEISMSSASPGLKLNLKFPGSLAARHQVQQETLILKRAKSGIRLSQSLHFTGAKSDS